MIYLIGGAARAGKTLIAHRLLKDGQTPCFCIDYLVTGLEKGAPELGIVGESPNIERAARLWPPLAWMLRNIIEVEPAYTVEGDSLWPRGAAQLAAEYPGQVQAVFLGYTNTTPRKKLSEIRRFRGGINDWIQSYSDAYILREVEMMIEFSRYVQAECDRLGLPYFDVSTDFSGGVERAYMSLRDGKVGK